MLINRILIVTGIGLIALGFLPLPMFANHGTITASSPALSSQALFSPHLLDQSQGTVFSGESTLNQENTALGL